MKTYSLLYSIDVGKSKKISCKTISFSRFDANPKTQDKSYTSCSRDENYSNDLEVFIG